MWWSKKNNEKNKTSGLTSKPDQIGQGKACENEALGLRASLDQIAQREARKREEERALSEQHAATREAKTRQEYFILLCSMTKHCFGIEVPYGQNPVQVDGMWMGIERIEWTESPDGYVEKHSDWRFCLHEPCPNCNTLRAVWDVKATNYDALIEEEKRKFALWKESENYSRFKPFKDWDEFSGMQPTPFGVASKERLSERIANEKRGAQKSLALYLHNEGPKSRRRFLRNCPKCGNFE